MIVAKALHTKVKQAQEYRLVKGVKLLGSKVQQVTLWYVDDISFSPRVERDTKANLVRIFN